MKKFIEKIETLDNIRQWEEKDSIVKESVSQHSFKVAAIANYFLSILRSYMTDDRMFYDFIRFSNSALSYAIMHDFDEAIFGRDVSHVVKYNEFNGDDIRAAINSYVDNVSKSDFAHIMIEPEWSVKRFVKMCDWLALITFVMRNQNLGAKSFSNEYVYCYNKIAESVREVEEILLSRFKIKIDLNSYIKKAVL